MPASQASIGRGAFVLGGLGAPLLVRSAAAQPALTLDYLGAVKGRFGAYARTMDGAGPLLAYHDGEPFPTASTIKVLIMATVFRALDAGELKTTERIRIGARDVVDGSETFRTVRPGTAVPLFALVNAMIRRSDNTAANALVSHFGFDAINAVAEAAGMTATRLRRHFLDYKAIVAHHENVSTPRDMASLLFEIERGLRDGADTIASAHSCRWMIEIMLGQEDRDKIPRGLPAGTPVANKTGEIDGVRSDVAVVDPYGAAPYVLVVLTKELRDYAAGVAAIRKIARDVDRAVRTLATRP